MRVGLASDGRRPLREVGAVIYLDSAATTFHKPPAVYRAVETAMRTCASPGRGGYAAAQAAERAVYRCRALAAELFDCPPESVCFTSCATEGLNIAIRTLVRPGDRVDFQGMEFEVTAG